MVIVSITGPRMHDALAQVAVSTPYADIFEFRLDLIERADRRRLFASTRKPAIATCRPRWEGGGFRGSESERAGILEEAASLGANYVDLELNCDRDLLRRFLGRQHTTKVIISFHIFDSRRFQVANIYHRLHASEADVIKFAFPAVDAYQLHPVIQFLSLARTDKRKAVCIAMGEHGLPSRILYRKFGAWATYAAPEIGDGAAPGQLKASELKRVYRSDHITRTTKVFGVIGNPLTQSKGAYVHNAMFRRAGRNSVYCKFPVVDLKRFMMHVAPWLSGFSVTIPHKQAVIRFLGRLDRTAGAIGAVNTVVRRGGILVGTNTDAPGALDAIEERLPVKGKVVLIVGAGGAARAIAFEAMKRGAEVLITNRTRRKATQLAKEFGLRFVSLQHTVSCEIIVNATSVGMVPHTKETPVPKNLLSGKIVFDAVYNPPMTRMLREARTVGARVIQGLEMYLNQAALQSALFCGRRPDMRAMRKILQQHL